MKGWIEYFLEQAYHSWPTVLFFICFYFFRINYPAPEGTGPYVAHSSR